MIYATIRNMNLKKSKESERNLALLLQVPLQFPFSSLPYCNPQLSHISDHQHEWLFSITAIWSSNTLQRNSKHQARTTNKETPNLLQWVNQPPTEIWHLLQTKMGKGLGYLDSHLLSMQPGGDCISRHSPWGAGESHCLHRHCTHGRGLVCPHWRQDFRNARWIAFF